jgi:hypothetical protein
VNTIGGSLIHGGQAIMQGLEPQAVRFFLQGCP